MRHETADAARRESSKTVEFFEIGALQQKLCLRDADAVHRVHCDKNRLGAPMDRVNGLIDRISGFGSLRTGTECTDSTILAAVVWLEGGCRAKF